MSDRFTGREWAVARSRVGAAEALTSRFYVIPDREWARHPYDVAGSPLGDDNPAGLARVVKLLVRSRRRAEPRLLYRIQLDENALLEVVRHPRGRT